MALCVYCGRDFGEASELVCLHCGAPLDKRLEKTPEPDYKSTKTKLSYNAKRILAFLDHVPETVAAPNAKTISAALDMDWGEVHKLLESLHEDGMVFSTVSAERGSQYRLTPRGKGFL